MGSEYKPPLFDGAGRPDQWATWKYNHYVPWEVVIRRAQEQSARAERDAILSDLHSWADLRQANAKWKGDIESVIRRIQEREDPCAD